jgi:hypothetical protein
MLAMFEDRTSPWNAYPDYRGSFSILGDGGINACAPDATVGRRAPASFAAALGTHSL